MSFKSRHLKPPKSEGGFTANHRLRTKLREGNVFVGVYLSVNITHDALGLTEQSLAPEHETRGSSQPCPLGIRPQDLPQSPPYLPLDMRPEDPLAPTRPVTSDGHYWRLVQTCSLGLWWLLKESCSVSVSILLECFLALLNQFLNF